MTGWAAVKEALRRRVFVATFVLVLAGAAAASVGAQAPPKAPAPAGKPAPAAQDEFVPVSQLPAVEQMPAGPLVLGAYAFIWAVVLAYVFSIGRRLGAVQRELNRLKQRIGS